MIGKITTIERLCDLQFENYLTDWFHSEKSKERYRINERYLAIRNDVQDEMSTEIKDLVKQLEKASIIVRKVIRFDKTTHRCFCINKEYITQIWRTLQLINESEHC